MSARKKTSKDEVKMPQRKDSSVKKESFDPGGKNGKAKAEPSNSVQTVERSHSLSGGFKGNGKELTPRSKSVNSLHKVPQELVKSDGAPPGSPDITVTESSNEVKTTAQKPKRLLLFSSKIKNHSSLLSAVLPEVKAVQYKYEGGPATLDMVLQLVKQALANCRVESIAFVPHTKPGNILLCNNGDKKEVLTPNNVKDQRNIHSFFQSLVENYMDCSQPTARLDFLACSALRSSDIQSMCPVLGTAIKVEVGMSKDIMGSEILLRDAEKDRNISLIGSLYFSIEKLKSWSPRPQSLAGFERIRTVGKGAYGAAVLYRKRDDDSLVILKEINMHDLNANERQMALNEIRVLSMLDHPNIISYYDSFEEDGTLMIEMEYADGGTLAEYLSSSQGKREIEEQEILGMFQQMVAGIRHIHEHKILHRDLKTANIFLTKDGIVKIGDFGISKVLSSNNQGANTVLGTPYYISPEICEGKPYNEKSDIWSLGCILYEMACLQKTFEGTNLPALVNKIMKGQFTPVKGNYSQEFKLLVQDMLQREPEYRPSANELLFARLPVMVKRYMDPTTDVEDEMNNSKDSSSHRKHKLRSVLYHIDTSEPCMPPVPVKVDLPSIMKIRQVTVSSTHTLVVTCDRDVYSWGEGRRGQLGHGDLQLRTTPERIEALKGKSIIRVGCGDGFSVFGSDNGIVMTCGDGSNGCLGHGDWSSASRPRLIEALLSVDVTALACGASHVVAVGSDGEVFAWGNNQHGQLGITNEENICEPQEVTVPEPVFIQDVKCGVDGTMFLTDVGMLLACGNNEDNKLGLNNRQGFLMAMKNMFSKTEVEGRRVPTIIKPLATFRVLDMVLGPHHSAVVVESGLIYTFGRNSEGQLGMNNTKPRENPSQVRAMSDKIVHTVACGESFTVCGTDENMLYFWGKGLASSDITSEESTKSSADCASLGIPITNGHQRTSSIGSTGSAASTSGIMERKLLGDKENKPGTSSPLHLPVSTPRGIKSAPPCSRQSRDDVFLSTTPEKLCPSSNPVSVWSNEEMEETISPLINVGSASRRKAAPSAVSQMSVDSQLSLDGKSDVFLQPTIILQLSSNSFEPLSSSQENYELNLVEVMCQGNNLYLQVETSCPLPKRRSKKRKRMLMRKMSNQNLPVPRDVKHQSAHSNDGGDEYTSSETSELDTLGTIPTWIKNELIESVPINDDNDADCSDEAGALSERRESERNEREEKGENEVSSPKPDVNGNEVKEAPAKKDKVSPEQPEIVSSDSGMESYRAHTKGRGRGGQPAGFKQTKPGATGGQRPLNRFRAGRGRARQSSWTIDGAIRDPPKKAGLKEKEDALSIEVKRLEQEKREAQEQMKKLEEQHKEHLSKMEAATKIATMEREKVMNDEIMNLRMELKNQSKQMSDNNQVMLQLQEQLVRLQSEQLRQSAREKRASTSGNDSKKKGTQSRLCLLS
ncbi:Serine/threonine-protein kinase Nek8 [Holothuria leucospilota]|uniref:non-specific serine/threonine protein kinase n=1 Tax=Holothuria leucospilota TaxID=206669 RepID=A0A9Q1H7R3_HOLLE|nr:Serine/threonine-protein kinase Nek8 [Holothuria leucospilota]